MKFQIGECVKFEVWYSTASPIYTNEFYKIDSVIWNNEYNCDNYILRNVETNELYNNPSGEPYGFGEGKLKSCPEGIKIHRNNILKEILVV